MSKDLEEKLEELKKVAGYRDYTPTKEVVEALKIHGELMYELIKSTDSLNKQFEQQTKLTKITLVLVFLNFCISITYFIIQLY